ncbi:ABC transporter substrate-binding protein [Hamadaea tsunoensis]|uniref:ABC transporter substrate-binding protein n=1 Tax=Hamadaea tsunoensis TaxID=53368 RepID=UPI0004201C85|nr:ABC transporter substrate-binding protein [Hamadaea tsunoensis]
MSASRPRSASAVIAASIVVALAVAGCASKRDDTSTSSSSKKDKLVFGVAGDAKVLDPALASDGESFRIARQVFEGLVRAEEGGTKIIPSLAESWTPDASGLVWTFKLRQGVKFQDGTDFNADAVCTNFNRWYNFSGLMQSEDVSSYWQDVFGGFAKSENSALPASLFKSCVAKDPGTVDITITRVTSKFPSALALPAFSMSSPKALQDYKADGIAGTADNVTYPEYALGHPVGTGAYKFVKWDHTAKTVELTRFDDYWGDKAKIKTLIFQTITDLTARKQALRNGQIQGYDLVAPADVKALKTDGFHVLTRPAFNILYLAINQSGNPALKDVRVRQAIAYAINRQAIVDSKYPEGSTVALEFQPPGLAGYNENVTKYAYDVNKAKELLQQAGVTNLNLKFYYPTEVTRPYMPAPKDIYELIAADLKAAGIQVTPVALKWSPDYINAVQTTNKHDLHLLGWTGDYSEAYNFIGTMFDRPKMEWGFTNPGLFADFKAADAEPDATKRANDYAALNAKIMDFVPGVPIAHGPPSLVLGKDVDGVKASPLTDEHYARAYYTE